MQPEEPDYVDDEPSLDPTPLPSWLVDGADLLAEPDPGPTPWLVEGLIVDQALTAAVGRWKTTKSYALLDVCISIATGRPAFGHLEIPNPGPVVFINEESGRAALHRRLDALCRGRAIDPEELRGRLYLAANARIKLDDAGDPDGATVGWQTHLLELGRELRPRLFVFDPLARMKGAARDENAQNAMAGVVEFLRDLREETGAGVLFVHHTGHQGSNMRGSSDLESVWESRLSWNRDGQSPLIELAAEHREVEASEPLQYRIGWDHDTRSMRFELVQQHDANTPSLEEQITAWVEQNPGRKIDEIAKGVETRADVVRAAVKEMVAAQQLRLHRSGKRDRLDRQVRDEVYSPPWNDENHEQTALDDLDGGASQHPPEQTPGTRHGTHHHETGHTRTSQNGESPETLAGTETVARPNTGTDQDAPHTGHRGSVARPTPLGVDARDEPPDKPSLEEHFNAPESGAA